MKSVMKTSPVSIFAIIVIKLGACFLLTGGANASDFQITVHTIDEVADGAMPISQNISATDAMIKFQSNTPLACSVVFGETRNFGQITVDDDMDGGAHNNHHPLLTGLTPETDYYFRVQGTASDGTIFVGNVQKFTTLALPADIQTDLATITSGARVVAVSSNYGGAENHQSWGGDGAIDGSRQNAWSSAGDGNDAFIEIELQEEAHIGEVSVWTRSMSDGTARILKFQLTIDGGKILGPFDLPNADQPHRFRIDVDARRLRLDVLESTGGNVGLIEFGAFPQ
jgi:hypothetical protein